MVRNPSRPLSLYNYLCTIAHNLSIDATHNHGNGLLNLDLDRCHSLIGNFDFTEQVADGDLVQSTLLKLKPKYREIIEARFFRDEPWSQTASSLGISIPLGK